MTETTTEPTTPKKPENRGKAPKAGKGTGRKRQNPEKGAMKKTSFTLHQETIDWLESQGNKSAIVRIAVAEYRERQGG